MRTAAIVTVSGADHNILTYSSTHWIMQSDVPGNQPISLYFRARAAR